MTGPVRSRRRQTQSVERHWEHIPDTFGSVEDISDALITREQDQFLLTDAAGNVPPANKRGLGLYSRDTRHLSVYELRINDGQPLVLLSTADSGFSQEQVLGNHRMEQDGVVVGRGTVELQRERVLRGSLEERLRSTNFNPFPVRLRITYHFDADFADIFEVRGHRRLNAAAHSPPEVAPASITYRCWGADGIWRRTRVVFDRAPDDLGEHDACFDLSLEPRQALELRLRVLMDEQEGPDPAQAVRLLRADYARWRESFAGIHTDNELFNEVLARSISDLRLLSTRSHQGESYIAAGTPWFATLFGRDSIITALETLPFRPDIARETLAVLARRQGQFNDPWRAEEPGKILHEVRQDELSTIGELPYERYYGSVDSTPLFLLLAAEYFEWTGDRKFIEGLSNAITAALNWLRHHGDLDGDGLLEYRTDIPGGLRNQGWKDSVDGVTDAEGKLCEGPIALCEVQGYAYAAYRKLSRLFEALGDADGSREMTAAAEGLRARFNTAFWIKGSNRLAMALDGQKRPADVMSSNAGQVLWSGLLSHRRAARVRDSLFAQDMFTGWGIRTLSSAAPAYYPLGYHVGTVWPHDNGIIAMGLKRYGFHNEVNEIATALFDAARQFPSYRLPELFGGQARSEYQPPVPYPVACRPQAWTAGAFLHLLQAMLGLVPDAPNQRLLLRKPQLPFWLHHVHLSRLRVGEAQVDLEVSARNGRTSVTVGANTGVQVVTDAGRRAAYG